MIWNDFFPFQNHNAKLSDFGLATDGPEGDETHVTTQVMGTKGYAAPEYISTGKLIQSRTQYADEPEHSFIPVKIVYMASDIIFQVI